MTDESYPPKLLEVRDKIDEVDRNLVRLLAERFALTSQVGQLKADCKLDAVDSAREERKLATVRALCEEQGLNPDLVSAIFKQIMAEVVSNHRSLRNPGT